MSNVKKLFPVIYLSELSYLFGAPCLILPLNDRRARFIRAATTVARLSTIWTAILAASNVNVIAPLAAASALFYLIEIQVTTTYFDENSMASDTLAKNAYVVSCFSLINFALDTPGFFAPKSLNWTHIFILCCNIVLIPFLILGAIFNYWWDLSWGCYRETHHKSLKTFEGGLCLSYPGNEFPPIICEGGELSDNVNIPGCSSDDAPTEFTHKHPHYHAAVVFEIFVFVLYVFMIHTTKEKTLQGK